MSEETRPLLCLKYVSNLFLIMHHLPPLFFFFLSRALPLRNEIAREEEKKYLALDEEARAKVGREGGREGGEDIRSITDRLRFTLSSLPPSLPPSRLPSPCVRSSSSSCPPLSA